MTKVKREKSFAVHWISSKCKENFCSFCFICMESAPESQALLSRTFIRKALITRFIKNLQKLQNFSLTLTLLFMIAMIVEKGTI